MSTAKFQNAVKAFVKAGVPPKYLLPIAPVDATISKSAVLSDKVLGKAPGRYNERSDTWSGLGGVHVVNGISKADYDEMKEWPTPNVGILGRAFPGIDSDAADNNAKRLVEKCLDIAFGGGGYAERIRGTGPRRLYAFKCSNPKDPNSYVRTRHFTYKLGGVEHKLDVIGYGGQYLIAGTHPSGDLYEWNSEYSLASKDVVDALPEIDNADMERFVAVLTEEIEAAGGELVRASGGGGNGEEIDTTKLKPTMEVAAVLEGLDQIPNNEENFGHRDDLVMVLAFVRAALGKKSLDNEVIDDIRAWATNDPDWCDDEYFDKVWGSLDRVRVSPNSLDAFFRRNGIRSHVKHVFNDDAGQFSTKIKKQKKVASTELQEILQKVADTYIFGHLNTRDGKPRYTMRNVWNVDQEWPGLDWFKEELAESDKKLLADLHRQDGYTPGKVGFANFLRDMQKLHSDIFYFGETKHPGYDKGEIFKDPQPDGSTRNLVNMRFISQTIRMAKREDKDPARSKADVKHILDFAKRLFGPASVNYELDTLAYMAQTGDRPGSLLFLVGDSGVGKSIWMNLQMNMFDGTGPEGSAILDGAKLTNESARRFMLAKVEGCRIVSIKELPEGSSARDMSAITSQLKQLVDPGPEGDYITVEAKGENARSARNFARVLISTNYENSIHVEQHDRRIFYVKAGITIENKPDEDYYSEMVDIIQDPERLAAFFRYLQRRDIGTYSRYSEPPVSSEKAERILAEMTIPAQRHCKAAIEQFLTSGRRFFDTEELAEVMTEMSENEYRNTGGEMDARTVYKNEGTSKTTMDFMNAIKSLSKRVAIRFPRELRTSKRRYPSIYFLAHHATQIGDFMEWDRDRILQEVDDEYARGLKEHPWATYRAQDRGQ